MKKSIILIGIILVAGCSRWIAPPYTNVESMSGIQTGMTLEQVNKELGIEPYDVYFKGEDGLIVIYNYRVKNRRMKVTGDPVNSRHDAPSQMMGQDWYGDKYFCYVYFRDRKVESVITDRGKLKSQDILVKNNNIYLIQRDKLGYYIENDTIIYVPMN